MKKKLNYLYIIFRDVIMLGTFIMAAILENARGDRLVQMLLLFIILFLWLHIREVFLLKFTKALPFTFLADIILLLLLEYSSKYVVNYYFNIYYFFTLLTAGFILQHRARLIVSFAVIISAFIKYYRLIQVVFPDENHVYNLPFVLSYMTFTFMVFITIAVFFNYSKLLSEEKSELDKLNRQLTVANEMLEEKNEKIKDLTIFEERNRIAREIHDSVGHNLTGLVMNLDFCEKLSELEPDKTREQIGKCKDLARESLSEIRRSVQALKPQAIEQLSLVKSIKELLSSSNQKFQVDTVLKIKGDRYNTSPNFNIVIYRAIQEAITNSVKHGKASKVEVALSFGETEFSVFIKDNGQGAKKFNMGNGLTGMTERVKEFMGSVSFYKNDGFMINILVPKGGIVNEQH